jgi:hypothetical protein
MVDYKENKMSIEFTEDGLLDLEKSGQVDKKDLSEYFKSSWREYLDENVSTDASMAGIKDLNTLGKNYINTKRMVGRDKISIPKEGDAPEIWNEFYKQTGVPDKEDGYELEDSKDIPKEFEKNLVDEKKNFMKKAFENKMSKKSANASWQYYQDSMISAYNKINSSKQIEIESNRESLQKEWGEGYDQNRNFAIDLFKSFDKDGSLDKWAESKELKQDANFIRLLHNISKNFKEDYIKEHDLVKASNTPLEYKSQLNALTRDMQSGKYQQGSKEYEDAVNRRLKLVALANR